MSTTENSSEDLLVIGAGLGRTGTNSLKLALETLLGGKCYHLKEIYLKHQKHSYKWLELDQNLQNEKEKFEKSFCEEVFRGYKTAVDHPVCGYYKQLMELYPRAKVVLTVRNPEIWLHGCRSTILPRDAEQPKGRVFYFLRWLVGLDSLHDMVLASWKRCLGPDVDLSDDTAVIKGFVQWNESVKEAVDNDRLLVYDVADGWEPLCRFLQLPIPTDHPFPHVNEYKELRRLANLERRAIRSIQIGLPLLLLIALAFLVRQLVLHWTR